LDEEVPPPATFAFSWLSGLLLYGTADDDGRGARDTWLLTHPHLRLRAALSAGMGTDTDATRELVEDGVACAVRSHASSCIPSDLWSSAIPVRGGWWMCSASG
jgi:hypothetical protein